MKITNDVKERTSLSLDISKQMIDAQNAGLSHLVNWLWSLLSDINTPPSFLVKEGETNNDR